MKNTLKKNFFVKKKEATGVVEVVLLLIVAVALCGLFKAQATTFLTGMFTTLTETANGMFT